MTAALTARTDLYDRLRAVYGNQDAKTGFSFNRRTQRRSRHSRQMRAVVHDSEKQGTLRNFYYYLDADGHPQRLAVSHMQSLTADDWREISRRRITRHQFNQFQKKLLKVYAS